MSSGTNNEKLQSKEAFCPDTDRNELVTVSPANSYSPDISDELHSYTDRERKRLARKIDLVLMPMMWLVHGFQGQDKSSISAQAIFGLRTDLHMHGQQFQLLNTIFNLAILVATVPSLILLQRFRLGLILNTYMTAWGICMICSAAVQTWPQLMAIRAIQGWFESICQPAFIILTSQYYQQSQHGTRALLWQSSSYCFSMMVSFVEYGLGKHAQDHPESIHAWRSICLFLGSGTLATVAVAWFLLGSPDNVKWLSPKEKNMVAARTIGNKSGRTFQTSTIDRTQVKEALQDPQVWFLFFHTVVLLINNGANSTYSRILYQSFGFTSLQVMLIDTPRPAVAFLIFASAFFYLKRFPNHRLIVMTCLLIAAVVGYAILAISTPAPDHKWLRWTAFVITVTGFISATLGMSMVASNFAGKTKRLTVLAVCFLGSCIGGIIGSQVFQTADEPRYIPAYVSLSSLVSADMVILIMWRLYLRRQNRIRDQAALAMGLTPAERERIGQELGEQDVTDRNNPHFRYAT